MAGYGRPSEPTGHPAADAGVRKSEGGFRLLVDSLRDYAIFTLDSKGNILTWNLGAERIKGYRAKEIIGKHFSIFYSVEDIESGKPERELKEVAAVGRFEDSGWRLRKDGSRFWADYVITALRDRAGHLMAFVKVTRDLTERKRAEDELRASQESLRELSAQLYRTQDEERRRIGRDLHDTVGQYLVMLKMHLDSLQSRSGPDEAMRQKLAECICLAEEAIQEVRTTSFALYPPLLEEVGLKSAIPSYLDGIMKRSGIVVELEIPPSFARPSRDVELAIFRVLQESLINILRHSESPLVHVRVQTQGGLVRLEVTDKGKGIPPEVLVAINHESQGKLGVGLRGMKERIRQLGGKLEVSSSAGGTTVSATFPRGKSS